MGPLLGIILTVLACVAALGIWGHTLQVISISMLGAACIIADLKAMSNQ
jgi:hypothetical protein